MANQCDFVETQLSASAQFGSNCCPGGPYFALSRRALLYTDDHDKENVAGIYLILICVIIRAKTYSVLKIGHIWGRNKSDKLAETSYNSFNIQHFTHFIKYLSTQQLYHRHLRGSFSTQCWWWWTWLFDDDEMDYVDDEDSDLEHNKLLWPFLCTLLSNAAAESLLRVRKKFTAYKARLGKSTFSHFIRMLKIEILGGRKIAKLPGWWKERNSKRPPPVDNRECVWNVKDLELGTLQFPRHSFVRTSGNLDWSQFIEIFVVLYLDQFCPQFWWKFVLLVKWPHNEWNGWSPGCLSPKCELESIHYIFQAFRLGQNNCVTQRTGISNVHIYLIKLWRE